MRVHRLLNSMGEKNSRKILRTISSAMTAESLPAPVQLIRSVLLRKMMMESPDRRQYVCASRNDLGTSKEPIATL